jgi:hypothetical protein
MNSFTPSCRVPQPIHQEQAAGPSLFEYRISTCPMVNSPLNLLVNACDFRLQDFDAFFEFSDRKWVQILPGKLHKRITGAFREQFVQVHG